MIVEIAKDNGANKRCKRFDWDDMIPIEVSAVPKIFLKRRKLKRALSLFSQLEWDEIFRFIVQNRSAIEQHWLGDSDSFELFRALKPQIISH